MGNIPLGPLVAIMPGQNPLRLPSEFDRMVARFHQEHGELPALVLLAQELRPGEAQSWRAYFASTGDLVAAQAPPQRARRRPQPGQGQASGGETALGVSPPPEPLSGNYGTRRVNTAGNDAGVYSRAGGTARHKRWRGRHPEAWRDRHREYMRRWREGRRGSPGAQASSPALAFRRSPPGADGR